MARKPRIHYPGACYHVILRGNARQDIFFEDGDRYRFFLLMQEGIERYGHRIHAFCLMTNHIHLVIQVADVPLPRIMQNLTFRYTRWANWSQGKSGHLFQGRYKAVLVDADAYLIQLVRYLHLNPVRAGITTDPSLYPWSSHRAYCGTEKIHWLCTDFVLASFDNHADIAMQRFVTFVTDALDEGHRPEFHGLGCCDSRLLGDDSFAERVLSDNNEIQPFKTSIRELASAVCRYYCVEEGELQKKTHRASHLRAMLAWLALDTEGCTLTEVADMTGRDITTLSCIVKKLRVKAMTDLYLLEDRRAILENVKVKSGHSNQDNAANFYLKAAYLIESRHCQNKPYA